LANLAKSKLEESSEEAVLFDLSLKPLPLCDGMTAYADPNVKELASFVKQADAVLIASPVYNYDVNAAAKNAIELTGRSWTGKLVGFMLAAGGPGSYMSAMGVANSLMLDFRCLIIPRFIYALGDAFEGNELTSEDINQRLDDLIRELTLLKSALKKIS
jgi:FMN reductase